MGHSRKRPNRTLGPHNDIFWSWCAQDQLHLPRCTCCGALIWPIEPACPRCAGTDVMWERLSGRGVIHSWCTFERDYYGGMLPMPWDCILVALEEGPLFVSNPEDLDVEAMRLGQSVEVTFVDCEDSAGAFRLPVFKSAAA